MTAVFYKSNRSGLVLSSDINRYELVKGKKVLVYFNKKQGVYKIAKDFNDFSKSTMRYVLMLLSEDTTLATTYFGKYKLNKTNIKELVKRNIITFVEED